MPARIRLRRVHRWAGVVALAFLVMLSLTGIALNHASVLGLDQRFVAAPWLLRWYGMDVPDIAASYEAVNAIGRADQVVSLVGNRLFVGAWPSVQGVGALRGAAATGNGTVVLTDRELLMLSSRGELLDRVPIALDAGATTTSVGLVAGAGAIVVETSDGIIAFDAAMLDRSDVPHGSERILRSRKSVPSEALRAEIAAAYRGPGLSLERLVYDLHSGRWLESTGVLLMDLVALLVVFLAISGVIVWLRPRA